MIFVSGTPHVFYPCNDGDLSTIVTRSFGPDSRAVVDEHDEVHVLSVANDSLTHVGALQELNSQSYAKNL